MNTDAAHTEVLTFRGIVQGVGFRPTVYRIAQQLGMKGLVRNMGGIVQIVCTATASEIDTFIKEIIRGKPPMSRIEGIERQVINTTVFHEFLIGTSSAEEDEISILPADIALCADCEREFYDERNPRHLHPFISCTSCGPRYTIMERLPYDRDTTTMIDFPMCSFCAGEYTQAQERRYHAQTISCHDCGPAPLFRAGAGGGDPVSAAVRLLKSGGVLALKGVGGYYLTCSPFDEAAVQALRKIKRREQKPFAVLFRDTQAVRAHCALSPAEEALLTSPQRPIVLLEKNATGGGSLLRHSEAQQGCAAEDRLLPRSLVQGVSNTSRFVGAFLPSFGLQLLLLDQVGALIMTSANHSELPLITCDDEMEAMLRSEPLIGGMLYNRRRIAAGLDDSVAHVIDETPQLVRRAKGYVPAPVFVKAADTLSKKTMIFAAGGHLKSSLALSKGAYSYLSRHIGELDSLEAEALYRETFLRMKAFFGIEPALAVCDLHPRYFPTRFAKETGLPLLYVQHHHAHIASVMAEHGLSCPVIGVAFDGTGYGSDGTIWGGEILICRGVSFERFSHLKTVELLGGDASMKDAWKSALSHLRTADTGAGAGAVNGGACTTEFEIDLSAPMAYCAAHGTLETGAGAWETASAPDALKCGDAKTAPDRRAVSAAAAALRAGVNTVRSSSMGRLFDAVCAMLGIHATNRYEGECAALLESAAWRALKKRQCGGEPESEQERLALEFHLNTARAILLECRRARAQHGLHRVCLSGGVFQNRILTEEALRLLRTDGFTVYRNIHVPPNDGGIALGQNYIGMLTALSGEYGEGLG